MIDADFVIKYTDALYSALPEIAPRYDEFRDMFSSGQLYSKQWILKELSNIDQIHLGKSFAITGAWFGTLGMMIRARFPSTYISMIDIDPRCEKFIHHMIYNNPAMKAITADMYEYHYKEDVVVNTSCEHIPALREWLNIIPLGRTVVLQSNNFTAGLDHINCVNSKEEFVDQTGLSNITYSGELSMPMYTRYMIIGTT